MLALGVGAAACVVFGAFGGLLFGRAYREEQDQVIASLRAEMAAAHKRIEQVTRSLAAERRAHERSA